MKKFKIKSVTLIAALALISFNSLARQDNNVVPTTAKNSFNSKYPQAQLKKWKTKKNSFIAMFIMNGKKYSALYDQQGNWLSTDRIIHHKSSLPVNTVSYLNSNNYASWKIDKMEKLSTPLQSMYVVKIDNHSGNPNQYEGVGLESDKTLYFTDNGKFIKSN